MRCSLNILWLTRNVSLVIDTGVRIHNTTSVANPGPLMQILSIFCACFNYPSILKFASFYVGLNFFFAFFFDFIGLSLFHMLSRLILRRLTRIFL